MRGFYMDEPFTGSPSDLQHISHDTNFTAKQWVDNTSASLAPIEATSTASQPYTVGKRLVYGGRLYKVTQAIAQGGTLTPGTNIAEDDVASEFDAINADLSNITVIYDQKALEITVPANSGLWIETDVHKSGKTAVGVVGMRLATFGNMYIQDYYVYRNSSTNRDMVRAYIYNPSVSAQHPTAFNSYILYMS